MSIPLQRESLVTQIQHILREKIVTLEFRPGEKLSVDVLSKEFGVSRTPIREALNLLVDASLVTVRPRVGYYVVSLTRQDVRELADVRRLFEVFAVERACVKLTDAQIANLLERLARVRALPAAERTKAFHEEDRHFHNELLACTENSRLIGMATQIQAFVELTRHMNVRVEKALDEHADILDALARHDVAAARAAMETHLSQVTTTALDALDG